MTGLERNADIVHMATYAPLLAHVDAWQWRPDLIWFDNLRCVRTPNYYVQKLYAHYRGTNVLPFTLNKKPLTGQEGLYASAVIDTDKQEIIIKLSNVSNEDKDIRINIEGLQRKMKIGSEAQVVLLKGEVDRENRLDNPDVAVPVKSVVRMNGTVLEATAESQSFNVYVISY
ncbi:hypothetical protein SDC9_170634 [bioreactor metagenome]|uniref:Alpha-L-arabinofuranosidase C-terminal domain-containing protein n=2 Tax=root TaxID=1 RepID=A0A645GAU5_9ZZZZ